MLVLRGGGRGGDSGLMVPAPAEVLPWEGKRLVKWKDVCVGGGWGFTWYWGKDEVEVGREIITYKMYEILSKENMHVQQ